MSAAETRRLIGVVHDRFNTLSAQIPMQPFKEQLEAIGTDLHTILLLMLSRIETLEDQLKKQ